MKIEYALKGEILQVIGGISPFVQCNNRYQIAKK